MKIGSVFCRTRNGKPETCVVVTGGLSVIPVPADVVGPFAIHRSLNRAPGLNVTLTHVRSGLVVRRFSSRKEARRIAAELIKLGNWDRPVSRLPKSLLEEAGRTVNRMSPFSQ